MSAAMRDRASIGVLGALVAWLAIAALASHERVGEGEGAAPSNANPVASASNKESPSNNESPSLATLTALRDGTPIDLNRVSARDLELLPGIGPRLAQRIVDDRARRGGAFATIEQLGDVSGIGPAKLAALRQVACVGASCARAAHQRSNANTNDKVVTK